MYIWKGRIGGTFYLSWKLSIVALKSGPLKRFCKEISHPSNCCYPCGISWIVGSIGSTSAFFQDEKVLEENPCKIPYIILMVM
jgi:hypothetical protein